MLVMSSGSLKGQSMILTLPVMEIYIQWSPCQPKSLSPHDEQSPSANVWWTCTEKKKQSKKASLC